MSRANPRDTELRTLEIHCKTCGVRPKEWCQDQAGNPNVALHRERWREVTFRASL